MVELEDRRGLPIKIYDKRRIHTISIPFCPKNPNISTVETGVINEIDIGIKTALYKNSGLTNSKGEYIFTYAGIS